MPQPVLTSITEDNSVLHGIALRFRQTVSCPCDNWPVGFPVINVNPDPTLKDVKLHVQAYTAAGTRRPLHNRTLQVALASHQWSTVAFLSYHVCLASATWIKLLACTVCMEDTTSRRTSQSLLNYQQSVLLHESTLCLCRDVPCLPRAIGQMYNDNRVYILGPSLSKSVHVVYLDSKQLLGCKKLLKKIMRAAVSVGRNCLNSWLARYQ